MRRIVQATRTLSCHSASALETQLRLSSEWGGLWKGFQSEGREAPPASFFEPWKEMSFAAEGEIPTRRWPG